VKEGGRVAPTLTLRLFTGSVKAADLKIRATAKTKDVKNEQNQATMLLKTQGNLQK